MARPGAKGELGALLLRIPNNADRVQNGNENNENIRHL